MWGCSVSGINRDLGSSSQFVRDDLRAGSERSEKCQTVSALSHLIGWANHSLLT